MVRIFALALALVLTASCTSESPVAQDSAVVSEPEGQGGIAARSRSILDVLPVEEVDALSKDEKFLMGLLLSPDGLDDGYKVEVARADDPHGGIEIGDSWFEPQLQVQGCSAAIDVIPMPTAQAVYVPGDPADSTASGQLGSIEAQIVALNIQLFDTRAQRDAMAKISLEFAGISLDDCEDRGNPFSIVNPVAFANVAYPGFALSMMLPSDEQPSMLIGTHSVGERVLLVSNLANPSNDPVGVLEFDTLAPFIEFQIAKLQEVGLG